MYSLVYGGKQRNALPPWWQEGAAGGLLAVVVVDLDLGRDAVERVGR